MLKTETGRVGSPGQKPPCWVMGQKSWPGSISVAGKPPRLWPATQANSAFYPQWDGKWVPAKVQWYSVAGSKGRYGSFHLWINVLVAGKTVWFLVNTCHTWAP